MLPGNDVLFIVQVHTHGSFLATGSIYYRSFEESIVYHPNTPDTFHAAALWSNGVILRSSTWRRAYELVDVKSDDPVVSSVVRAYTGNTGPRTATRSTGRCSRRTVYFLQSSPELGRLQLTDSTRAFFLVHSLNRVPTSR